MADFSRQNPGLNLTFPPAGTSKHEPGRLDETVQLVHPFLSELVRFREVEVESTALVAASVDSTVVPPGEVWYVPFAGLTNGDAAQALEFIVVNFILGVQVSLRSTFEVGAGALWPTVTQFPLHRPILLGPGFRLRGTRTAVGVAPLVLLLARIRLQLADIAPAI